jgi:hypothetical protein
LLRKQGKWPSVKSDDDEDAPLTTKNNHEIDLTILCPTLEIEINNLSEELKGLDVECFKSKQFTKSKRTGSEDVPKVVITFADNKQTVFKQTIGKTVDELGTLITGVQTSFSSLKNICKQITEGDIERSDLDNDKDD